jgi:hypothetical protein
MKTTCMDRWMVWLVLAAVLAAPGLASAQKKGGGKAKEEASTGDATKDAARKHFKKGVELFKAEEYTKALESFLASDELFHHPKTVLNIANCYEKLFELPLAMTYYTLYLEEAGGEATEAEKKDIDAKMERMKDKVGRIEVEAGVTGELVVDGKSIGQLPAPGPMFVYAGTHSVVIKSEGKIIFSKDVKVVGDGVESIMVEEAAVETPDEKTPGLEPLPTEKGKGKGKLPKGEGKGEKKEPQKGLLHVFSTIDGSDIVVNGKKVGVSPWEEELKEGAYDLKVSFQGYKSWGKLIDVQPEKTTTIDVDLQATKKNPAPYFWITAGAAVVCGAMWAGFGIDGIMAKKDAKDKNPSKNAACAANPACYNKYNDLVDRARRDFLAADITGPLALVFIGGTVALALLIKQEKNVPKAEIKVTSVSPILAPDGSAGGVGVTTEF